MKPAYLLTQEKGVALIIALLMLLVLSFVGVSAVSFTAFENNIAGNERLYTLAFYTADGGIENFRGRASAGEFVYAVANTGSYQVTIGGNTSTVSYERQKTSSGGIDYAVFKVFSEGRAPFPSSGKVLIESIVEVSMMLPEGYN